MKIAAVVVTYNRLNLLKECIDAIRNQTRKPDDILVINNSSTDGTEEWLKSQPDLTTITQENLGGAGGFYTGIKTTYERGYDWIWCMDDDGKPEQNCLKMLLENITDNNTVLHPLVLAEDGETFSFGCWIEEKKLIKKYSDFLKQFPKETKTINSLGTPFNGTLLNKNIISKSGFPNPKYFIWGDESEYIHRIKNHGFKFATVCPAIFYHPHNPLIYSQLDFEIKDWWKLYYHFRNLREIFILNNGKLKGNLKYNKVIFNNILMLMLKKHLQRRKKIKYIFTAFFHSYISKYGKVF